MQLLLAAGGQVLQLPAGNLLQGLAGKGLCLALVVQRRQEGRTEGVHQLGGGLVREQKEVLPSREQGGDGPRHQGRADFHQHALLLGVAAGQGDFPLPEQGGHHGEHPGVALLPVLQHQGGRAAFHGGVEVLDKELFRARGAVAGQIQQGGFGAFQRALPPQRGGEAPQRAVASRAVGAGDHCPAQGAVLPGAGHKGPLKGDEQPI